MPTIQTTPLMPKGTALWLIDNTKLSFDQIADFCGLHILEVQSLADNEHLSIAPFDPIASGQLTLAEIERCEVDSKQKLRISEVPKEVQKSRKKYVPIARRSDRPNAIAWMIKNYPKIPDSALMKLLGTTTKMVSGIRDRTYWNYANLQPRNPASLDLCSDAELEALILKYNTKED